MSIVVVGGTGRVGSKLVRALTHRGCDTVAAAPSTGVDAVTGDGLADVLAGASVVVDVSNAPSFGEDAASEFFTGATANLLAAGSAAGVTHHIALSVVGTDRLAPQSGYFRAKLAQERLIADGPIAYSVVRATQLFEFLNPVADAATDGGLVRLPPALIQPVESADVADLIADVVVGGPLNGVVEVAGPERFRLDDVIRILLTAHGDPRRVVADAAARYWGIVPAAAALLPADDVVVSEGRFADWVLRTAATT